MGLHSRAEGGLGLTKAVAISILPWLAGGGGKGVVGTPRTTPGLLGWGRWCCREHSH